MTVITRVAITEQEPTKTNSAINQIAEYIDTNASAWANIKSKLSSFTRDISLSTALAITGVGFTPKIVFFMSVGVSSGKFAGIGFDNATLSPFLETDFTDTIVNQQPQQIIRKDAANYNFFSISSMDADGFTLAWSKTGTPTGTATIYYLAIA